MNLTLVLIGTLLILVQVLAALPWVLSLSWESFRDWFRKAPAPRLGVLTAWVVGISLGGGAAQAVGLDLLQQRDLLENLGRVYGSILQLQLTADVFVAIFAVLSVIWPKGAAVARAAFREGHRQPMFWLFAGLAIALMVLAPFVPYFTFGEDHIMVKELGYDTIMAAAVLFGVIAAGMSISEEIEGRTAVTLMSKPVSRRQFLLGKFVGILMVCLVLVFVLGWFFQIVLLYKNWFDRLPPSVLPPSLSVWLDGIVAQAETQPGMPPPQELGAGLGVAPEMRHFLRGVMLWMVHAGTVLPGLVMAGSMVMVMVAVAVALATRLPMVVNLVTCVVLYVLANLMPVLVQTTQPVNPTTAGPVQKLLHFMAQLFDALLPGLDMFRVRPTVVDETTLPMGEYLQHVGAVTLYGVLFTSLILLLGLVLFEDRDLA